MNYDYPEVKIDQIEQGIPLPSGGKRRRKDDGIIESMNEGDSVKFSTSYEANRFAMRIRSMGWNSAMRKYTDNEFRTWKLKKKE